MSDEGEWFVVDKILDAKLEDKTVKYLIRWEGYTSDDDTWEPEGNLSKGIIKEYWDEALKSGKVDLRKQLKSHLPAQKPKKKKEVEPTLSINDWMTDISPR